MSRTYLVEITVRDLYLVVGLSLHGKDAYRHWRNKVQGAIKTEKHHYYQEKVPKVEHVNPAKWWRDIKKLAGQVAKQEWYHQFLDKDTDIKRLANKINSYFVGLTDHFPPLCQGVPPLSVPDELLISEYEAYKSLSSLHTPSQLHLLLSSFAPMEET